MTSEAVPTRERVAGGLMLVLALASTLHRVVVGQVAWSVWSDRDLARADLPWSDLPTSGAELSWGTGARIPGGATYQILELLMGVDPDPEAVYQMVLGLDLLGLIVLAAAVWRFAGPLAAGVAAVTVAGSSVAIDDMRRLWNPSLLPLFASLATGGAALAIAHRRAVWLIPAAFGLAISAQLHLSATLLGVGLVVPIALARPRGLGAIGAALVALIVPYVPYLLDEAAHGWPNQTAMREQPMATRVLGGRTDQLGSVDEVWRLFVRLGSAEAPLDGADASLGVPPVVRWISMGWPFVVLAVVLGVAIRAPAGPLRRVVRSLVVPLALVAVVYALDPAVELESGWTTRYVQAFVPAWGVLAGVAVVVATRWMRPGVARGALTLVVLGTGLQLVQVASATRMQEDTTGSWDGLVATVEGVQAQTGWTLPEVTGRTVLLPSGGDVRRWRADDAVDHWLRRVDGSFPGSLAPPCAMLFFDPPGDVDTWPSDADVRAVVRHEVPGLRVLSRHDVPGARLVLYTMDGPCFSSMANRYLPTPVEQELVRRARDLEHGVAVREPLGDVDVRWVGRIDDPRYPHVPALYLLYALDVHPVSAGLSVTLRSNQLRGNAYNAPPLHNAAVYGPTLVLTGEDGSAHRIVLAPTFVGHIGALTPLTATTTDVPPGAYTARLEFDLAPVPRDVREAYDRVTRYPMVIPLPGGVTVLGTP